MDASVSENERTTSTPVASYRSATATVSLGNRHSRNSVSVPLSILKEHLTCPLCQGYFRDPYTIVECLHSFCKSCLVYTFSQGFHRCPTCRSTELHPDPYRRILSDRSLQDFVSRTFPDLDRVDDNEEEKFYLSRGISRDIRTIGEERTAIEKVENDETARHVQETDDEDSDETRDSCRYMMKRKAKSLSKLNEVASPPSHSKRRRAPHLFLDETDRQSEQRLTSEGKVKHLVYRDSAMENSKNVST